MHQIMGDDAGGCPCANDDDGVTGCGFGLWFILLGCYPFALGNGFTLDDIERGGWGGRWCS